MTPQAEIQPYLSYSSLTDTFTFAKIDDSTALSGEIETAYTVTISLVGKDFEGNQVFTDSESYTWTIKNPCRDPSAIVWNNTPQPFVPTDDYSNQNIAIVQNNFSVTPSLCSLTITCVSVTPSGYLTCEDLDADNNLEKSFDGDDYTGGLTPGTYTWVYEATTAPGVAGVSR